MSEELLFSLTAKDFEWSYSRGTGAGGQKRNKTSSCVRCYHQPSGAVGESDDTRSQHANKRIAFERMAKSKKMQEWIRLEAARVTGVLAEIEQKVDREMRVNLRVEAKDAQGRWVVWDDRHKDEEPLSEPEV